MKLFEMPKAELVKFSVADVITTSGGNNEEEEEEEVPNPSIEEFCP